MIFVKMKNKKLILLSALLLSALTMSAIPARKGLRRNITLDDGRVVSAELRGDEFFSFWQTDDGGRYVLDADKGVFTAHDFDNRMMAGAAKRNQANRGRVAVRRQAPGTRAGLGEDHAQYVGKKKGLIILVNFADTKFGFGHNNRFYNRMANETGYTSTLGHVGSVKDYFLAQSNGQFELDFDIAGPYTLPQKVAYYGQHDGNDNDRRAGTMVATACKLADPDVDYSQYDWDGDGYVDQVYVLYAGLGEANGGDENTIWPHEYQLRYTDYGGSMRTDDGVSVDRYACGSELQMNRLGNRQVGGIGTLCHEFSHCLGLPDMYDTQYGGNYGMNTWDLLDQGSYNDADGRVGLGMCPPNYSSYEKWYCGWVEPTVLSKPTTVKGAMAQHDRYGQVFVVYNDQHPDEYYLLENRRNDNGDTWDQSIAASGLMIMHVDYNADVWNYNIVNTTTGNAASYFNHDHQSMTIFHADNSTVNNRGDLYPYNGNNSLTDTSTPAATIYNNGTLMGKPITNITKNDDGSISFDFMGGSTQNVVDGIQQIKTDAQSSVARIYTLDGRCLGSSLDKLPKGVYVVNGRKVVK